MELRENLDEFLLQYFEGIYLKKPLFYNSSIAIRFEMGGGVDTPEKRVKQVKQRAIKLFNALHKPSDEIYFVLFIDKWDNESISDIENIVSKVFSNYISKIDFRNVIKQVQEFRYKDLDDIDDIVTIRYCADVKYQQLKLEELVEAIANRTLGLEPTVDGDIYLLNKTSKTIFHLYDDRGLDILAENKEILKSIYEKYNDWILGFDRERIEEIFGK